MQLQYTMTRRDLRDQFAALGRTRGSLGARYVATNRLMMALVFVAALGVSGWRTVQRAGGLNAVAAATLVVLALLLAVFLAAYWALAPRLFASVQLLALRAALDSLTAAPYTLQLADGQLHYQGPSLNAGRGALDCAVTGLRAVRRDKAGLVVIFADGSACAQPRLFRCAGAAQLAAGAAAAAGAGRSVWRGAARPGGRLCAGWCGWRGVGLHAGCRNDPAAFVGTERRSAENARLLAAVVVGAVAFGRRGRAAGCARRVVAAASAGGHCCVGRAAQCAQHSGAAGRAQRDPLRPRRHAGRDRRGRPV